MAIRLKTEEQIEADLLKAAAMVRARAAADGDTFVASAPLSDIVAELKAIMKRDGIGGPQNRH